MDKEEYQELLKSEEWQNKRLIILKRDNYKCVKCNCKKNLHVHHTYYLIDKMPWQVPNDCLITLCKVCHEKEHKGKSISTFFRKRPPKKKPKTSRKSRKEEDRKQKVKNKIQGNTNKVDKIKTCSLVAVKSKTLNKVYNQSDNWEEVAKNVKGIVKGFDNKNLAEHWLRQDKAGKCKNKR